MVPILLQLSPISKLRSWLIEVFYLTFIRDTGVDSPLIESIFVVWEFIDVFPTGLLGVPLDRGIDIAIDIEPGTKPINILSYHMSLAELKELKDQL